MYILGHFKSRCSLNKKKIHYTVSNIIGPYIANYISILEDPAYKYFSLFFSKKKGNRKK